MHLVLELLHTHKLQVKNKKSYVEQTSIHYLGFIIDQIGINVDPAQVQAPVSWPIPSTAVALKRFLGGLNFYRCFTPHFSHIAHSLHQLSNHTVFP